MKLCLPTQPSQSQSWEEGSPLLPRLAKRIPTNRLAAGAGPMRSEISPAFSLVGILRKLWLLSWVMVLSALSFYVASHYVVSGVIVQGRSMTPTLQDGERYILNRLAYHYRLPIRGDLVVLRDPGHNDYAVKRIVALPCDSVHLKDGIVYINGQKLEEPYLTPGTQTYAPDLKDQLIVIGKGHYFVLGDNRPESFDSHLGWFVPVDNLIGRAWLRYWPPDELGMVQTNPSNQPIHATAAIAAQ